MGEDAGACDIYYDHVVVCKGKRSKRQRVHVTPPSPEVMVVAAEVDAESSSSVADDVWRSACADPEEAASGCVTEEEEDMALCLMLLARGGGSGRGAQAGSSSSPVAVVPDAADSTVKEGKFRSRRPADGGAGEFVYECKTCGRCFPSFQALGGHRTSHKKPRLLPPTDTAASDDEKTQTPSPPSHAVKATSADPTVLAIPAVPATPPKQEAAISTEIGATRGVSRRQHQQQGTRVHECSFCGAEFGSGQALGGHMRRHRPLVPASASSEDMGAAGMIGVKEKSFLELDLNMPAPCEDATAEGGERTASFTFAAREKPATAGQLFPASALVDCQL